MTTGQLVQAVTLFSVLSFPLRVVGYFLEDAPMAVVALDRVDAALADGTAVGRCRRRRSACRPTVPSGSRSSASGTASAVWRCCTT